MNDKGKGCSTVFILDYSEGEELQSENVKQSCHATKGSFLILGDFGLGNS